MCVVDGVRTMKTNLAGPAKEATITGQTHMGCVDFRVQGARSNHCWAVEKAGLKGGIEREMPSWKEGWVDEIER